MLGLILRVILKRGSHKMVSKLRFGVACVTQESNTFAPFPSTISDFSIEIGAALIDSSLGTNTEVGGFLRALDALQVKVVPLVSAFAVSAGPVSDLAFAELSNLLIKQVTACEFDGLLLALHGAWSSVSYPSADAELVKRVRQSIGSEIPIVITLDLHANVTPSLVREVQGIVGYRTYPHVDMGETGERAATLLYEIVTHRLRPCLYWLSIPLLGSTPKPPQPIVRQLTRSSRRLDRELPRETKCSPRLSFVCSRGSI